MCWDVNASKHVVTGVYTLLIQSHKQFFMNCCFFFLASLLNFVEHNLAHILSEYSEPSQTNQKGTTLEGEKKRS